jgi:hypothetical protein
MAGAVVERERHDLLGEALEAQPGHAGVVVAGTEHGRDPGRGREGMRLTLRFEPDP